MEPSRFWLRRDDDDRSRQVVYDEVRLNRYSHRQRRAILKVMARGKTASHRDISDAVRRARARPRGEILIAIILGLSVLAVLAIILAGRHHGQNLAVTTNPAASAQAVIDETKTASPADLSTVMENADRAWLNDVGTGKVVTANDGSDALSLPRSTPQRAVAIEPTVPRARGGRDWSRQRP